MKTQRTNSKLIVEVECELETERLGRAIGEALRPNTVVGLVGPLGAGKTRLVRAIAESLGVSSHAISSPTFVLIHEYDGLFMLYHFDAYRLASADEFSALGADDYFTAGGVCLIEWADRVRDTLPRNAWEIAIEPTSSSGRRFSIRLPSAAEIAKLERCLASERTGR